MVLTLITVKLFLCGGELSRLQSEHALGLGYLKSNCTGADIEIVRKASDLKDCDIVGLSSVALGAREAVSILHKLPATVKTVIGGQLTLWPGLVDYDFDHIVVGEGERAFQKIIDGTVTGRVLEEPLIEDIDTLAYPDRGKVRAISSIFSSRGCAFNCSFCSSQRYWKRARYHSAAYVLGEVAWLLASYPQIQVIDVHDDLFIANKKRFFEIAEGWLREGFHNRVAMQCFVRSKVITDEIAQTLKRMRCVGVRFGVEAASDRLLKILGKGVTMADHEQTVEICNRAGLSVAACFMHHTPTETEEEFQASLDWLKSHAGRCSNGGYYRYQPFPGTDLWNGESPMGIEMTVRK